MVFDVKLRIPEWKILFAIDGEKSSSDIAQFLDMSESDVSLTLQKLSDLELISAGDLARSAVLDTNGDHDEDEATLVADIEDVEVEEAEDDFTFGGVDEEPEVADEPQSAVVEGDDDDLEELIGNLLEEDNDTSDSIITEADETITPDLETRAGEEDFDLGSIFSEDLGDEDATVVADSPADTRTPTPAAPAAPTGDASTILVVDDSVVIRKMVEIALENENYNIVSVATGKDALTYLDENDPDLIILDIMLSDVNGLDVLKAIKASKQIPVVMLSAKDTPRETTKAKQLGADDFIPKPFKDEELVSKVKELVKK